jgi:uncharacterized protein with ParB-like and HNH nuclease domain/predicted transport protein
MQAGPVGLLNFLDGRKQFVIPIYQRPYSWTLKQCEQLWMDIARVAADSHQSGHFIGSVVYIQKGLFDNLAPTPLLVIDGQQRLTTLTLLLVALGRAIQLRGEPTGVSHEQIRQSYLTNAHEKDESRYKLLLTQADRETLKRLIDGTELPEPASRRLVENYQFFEEQIANTPIELTSLLRGIAKLIVVDISLDRQHDNPQLIFESLNSTGLDLSQADLIRNYVLMALEPNEQTNLYTNRWQPMEQRFGEAGYTTLFDRFMRDYLTLKTGRIPNIREVYQEFKLYAQTERAGSITLVVDEIHQFSKYFTQIALEREEDPEIRSIIHDINTLKVDVAYPLIMKLFDDHQHQWLQRDELIIILKLIESYVLRRAICGVPPNSLNNTFASLCREIDRKHYLESFQAALLLKDGQRRFPGDDEFKPAFMVKDVYNFRSRNYLLHKLENRGRKVWVAVEKVTVEHIMPQNPELSADWQNELGENWKQVHARYLHTIGNLTLTGYNSELSDRPFSQKQRMEGGFADSPIHLNRGLAKLERWTEDEILQRAEALASQAVGIWPAPRLAAEVLSRYGKPAPTGPIPAYTLDDHRYLCGEMRPLFEQLRRRILNLDASVSEQILKLYIAYKTVTNFVDIVPQKSRLLLSLNIGITEIDDPEGWCRNVTMVGRLGNGDVECGVSSTADLDYALFLVRQAFEKQAEDLDGWALPLEEHVAICPEARIV